MTRAVADILTTVLLIIAAAVLTLPLLFLFVAIPSFMLLTTGSELDEAPEFYFWALI
ncbi:MAG TPA: hypothetical protein VNS22_23590 [Geminicoccus sp.]|uniref:hypothetical protein n=1 Tax=Geminicoccus sp. TaxID=2024832 RepID=UPI002B8985AF|nr:hypothetical protein [Geminicoccus sp.]HWL71339.1 hypothetical protein [Geminicoccus sp.]